MDRINSVVRRLANLAQLSDDDRWRIRRRLNKLGIHDDRLHRLAVKSIAHNDVFICSFPKSGNTWMRFLIANALAPDTPISFRNIDTLIPNPERCKNPPAELCGYRFVKTHMAFLELFPRAIYIARNPLDAMVSYYHYSIKNGWYSGCISGFLRSTPYCGSWRNHALEAINFINRSPDRLALLKYEDMLADCTDSLLAVMKFLQIPLDRDAAAIAVEKCSFDRLRKMELQSGGELNSEDQGFFRSGRSGSGEEELSQADRKYFLDRCGREMAQLGYA